MSRRSGRTPVLLSGDPDQERFAVLAAATIGRNAGTDFCPGRHINALSYGPDPDLAGFAAAV